MRKRISAVAAVVLLAAVGSAVAAAPSPKLTKHYLHLYAKVVHVQGKRAPGRNIIRWGLASGRPATAAQVRKSVGVLHRMLPTLRPVVELSSAPTTQNSTSYHPTQVQQSSGGGGGGGSFAACIRQHESGGNYSYNDGTYGGAYNFDTPTWHAAGGSGSPADASPAEQDARFQSWYASHPTAWPTRRFCGG